MKVIACILVALCMTSMVRSQNIIGCVQDLTALATEGKTIWQNYQDGKYKDITSIMPDAMALYKDLQAAVADCVQNGSTSVRKSFVSFAVVSTNECDDILTNLENKIPDVVKDIQDKNVFAILSDYSTVSGMINDFQNKCLSTSADCQAKENTLEANAQDLLTHLQAKDQAAVKSSKNVLIDNGFDWYDTCVGPQGLINIAKIAFRVLTSAQSTGMTASLVKRMLVGDDKCTSDINQATTLVQTISQQVQDHNIFGLIASISQANNLVNDFQNNCINTSDDCKAKLTNLQPDLQNSINDAKAHDKDSLKTHTDNLVDGGFDYFNNCIGPQQLLNMFFY